MQRHDRALLLERDPEKTAATPIKSLREADWRHQTAALVAGYSSLTDMAVDELIVLVRELQDRVAALEGRLERVGWATQPLAEIEPDQR